MRTHPFWVSGQGTQPSFACLANHAIAGACETWSGSNSAIRTLTSSRARTVTHLVDQLIREQTPARSEWPQAANRFRLRLTCLPRTRQRFSRRFRNHLAHGLPLMPCPLLCGLEDVLCNIEGGAHAVDTTASRIRCRVRGWDLRHGLRFHNMRPKRSSASTLISQGDAPPCARRATLSIFSGRLSFRRVGSQPERHPLKLRFAR